MSQGYIYVLSNPSFARDLYKVGVTRRSPEGRMNELGQSTGIPTPFVLEYAEFVPNAVLAEKLVHELLLSNRINERREFFNCSLLEIIKVIRNIADGLRPTNNISQAEMSLVDLPNQVEERPNLGIFNFNGCYNKAVGVASSGVKYCDEHLAWWSKC